MIRQYVMTSTLKHWRKIYYSSVLNIQEAMPLSQLFEVLFDSSVVVKYPKF